MSRKIIPNQEMLNDLLKIGDKDFSTKWDVSLRIPIRIRKEYKIKSFNNVHATKEHKIEGGIEYKWCQKGHWEIISEFNICSSRWDGLRCYCKFHSRLESRKHYQMCNIKETAAAWRKTENGKMSLRNTWRKQASKKKSIYVSWTRDDEEKVYKLFDGRCAYCSKEVSFDKIEFDHFIPKSKGGTTDSTNMIPCCTKCNHGIDGKFTYEALE